MRWLDYIFNMEFLKRQFRLILTAIILAASTCGKAITCTAGDFAVGRNASLVCYFPDDIDNHHSVLVKYSPFSAPTDTSYVLHCIVEDVKASTCKEQDGNVLKSHTRNTLVVEIVNITEKAAGRYTCQFLPPDRSPREMCSLTVRGKTTGVTPMEVVMSQDSSTINLQSGETGTVSVGTLVGVIVAFIVVAAVVAVIIIIVVIVFRRRHKRPAETQGIEIVDRPMMKRTIDTQVSVERALAAPLISTQHNGNKAPATGLAEKKSIQTQVSVDRGLAAPLINTQSSGTKTPATETVEKRSIQTQVSVDRGLAAPLINTQSNETKTPATGTTGTTPVQDDSEMNCRLELTKRKPPHQGQPKELVNSADRLSERKNLDIILENFTANPPRNV